MEYDDIKCRIDSWRKKKLRFFMFCSEIEF